jgi:6-phosphogluconolactonase
MASGPCHLAIDSTGRLLVTANYGDGSISIFPVDADGSLERRSDFHKHSGSGPDPSRQTGPHAHGVTFSPDNKWVLVPDLGTDGIWIYEVGLDQARLLPGTPPMVQSAPGSGPRHAIFSPDGRHVYAINELDNTVTLYDWLDGKLTIGSSVPTLPAEWSGQNTSAEIVIHPSGHYLYASNRGHNSIAVFRRDLSSGSLQPLNHIMLDGPEPRGFALSPCGNWLVVGNQKANTVSAFRSMDGGANFVRVGEPFPVPEPVSVLFD